ncbi:hypothetical protein ABZV68_13160 [Streptomyces clavifer]|uniref:hypothetical protein n=1 Tax=Streptomyces clavifer TaxID=68188 RepID=UPI0033A757A3
MAESAMPAAQSSTPATSMRNLLETVLDAIDLPHPATVGDAAAYHDLLDRRASLALVVARAALAENPADIGWNADHLRQRLTEYPPTYRAYQKPEAGR